MWKTGITYALLTVLWASPALNQESATGRTLTLTMKDAVDMAISPGGSVAVQLADESVRIAETHRRQSAARRRPVLDAYVSERNLAINPRALGFPRFPGPMRPGMSQPSRVGPFSTFDIRVRARYNLLNTSLKRANEASAVEVAAAEAGSEAQREEVGFRVAQLYLLVLRHTANVDARRANVELSRALVERAQYRESAGLGTAIDVTRMRSQLAADLYRASAARVEQELAELDLLNAMGLSLNTTLRLADSLELAPATLPAAAEATEYARQTRGDLRAQEKLIARFRGDDRAVHAQRLPTLDVFGDFGGLNADAEPLVATHTVGITLRVPVFDGGRRASRRAEIRAKIRQEELRRKQMHESLELEIEQALRKLSLTRQQVETAQTGLSLAEDELARARRRYKNGVTDSLEVVQAQTRLREAQSNHIEALFVHNRSRVDLARAKGDIRSLVE